MTVGKEKHMKEYKTILVEREGPVGKVIYNNPEKRNPMTAEMIDEATDAFLEFEKDDEVRVIMLTHKGPVFSAGMPQSELLGKSFEEILEISHKVTGYHAFIQRDITKPVIAVADGFGPIEAADIVILSDRTQFVLPAINIGLI
jgi:enoyl-CoA hydratase/carnithine racemase